VQRNISAVVISLRDLAAYILPFEIPASRLDAFIVVTSTDRRGTSRCSQTIQLSGLSLQNIPPRARTSTAIPSVDNDGIKEKVIENSMKRPLEYSSLY